MSDERVNWKSPVTESDTRFDDSNSDYAVNEKGNFNYHEEQDRETRVAAEEENYYLENFEEISSASSLNKRRKKIQIDRLSELPYSLLIHILSFLYIREAVRTSALSRKWQYLWYDLPKLELCEWSYETDKIRKFVTWVHRALVMRGVTNLEMFSVSFSYKKCFSSDVNIWVEFTFKNKVKEFSFYSISYEVNDLFMLPQSMYSNSSLTCLSLMGCVMAPRRTIDWESLTELHLSYVELLDHVIENILLGCPVLYDLSLWKCWGINCLEVNFRSLRELSVEDWRASHDNGSVVEISAPYVHFLTISLDHEGIKMQLTKISPLVLVNFDLNTFGCDCGPVDMMSNIKEIFEDLRYVKKLELGCGCIRALAILALKGWRLPLSARAQLVVNVQTDKHCTPGILDLLESSPNLETLSINLNYCRYEDCPSCFPDESDSMKSDLNCDLLQLKTIDIKCDIGPDSVGETLLIVAQLLLKRAKILSVMAGRGWRLPQSGREHLIVNSQRDEHSTPVILDLLESSPILETLVVHWTYSSYEECEYCHPVDSQRKKGDLNCDLLHLKTVYIICFIDPDTVAETLLKVVQLLLQRAKVLEKMEIDFRELRAFSTKKRELRAPSDSVGITETLLSYPRASPKAVLEFY